jgi:hypothetical protein
VEPQEYRNYAEIYGRQRVLELPFSNRGSVIPARNWIKDHSISEGHERHWQLDDNMRDTYRWYKGKRIRVDSAIAFRVCEDFTDRYENIAISGMNYTMFAVVKRPPFTVNCHVYSCTLFMNSLPHRWRGTYNEDTDICLQVLADGWCTVLFNIFLVDKLWTMTQKGGNTDEIYQDDGRLKMARSLERMWPGVVRTTRRFQRPQHHVHDHWKRFDTPLKLKEGIDLDSLENDEYGLSLVEKKEIRSEKIKKLVDASKE